jgi:hypothetical protein
MNTNAIIKSIYSDDLIKMIKDILNDNYDEKNICESLIKNKINVIETLNNVNKTPYVKTNKEIKIYCTQIINLYISVICHIYETFLFPRNIIVKKNIYDLIIIIDNFIDEFIENNINIDLNLWYINYNDCINNFNILNNFLINNPEYNTFPELVYLIQDFIEIYNLYKNTFKTKEIMEEEMKDLVSQMKNTLVGDLSGFPRISCCSNINSGIVGYGINDVQKFIAKEPIFTDTWIYELRSNMLIFLRCYSQSLVINNIERVLSPTDTFLHMLATELYDIGTKYHIYYFD